MKYIKESEKSVSKLLEDLEKNISENSFGVQHVHNIYEKLNSKGVELKDECLAIDVCNPKIAKTILDLDMSHSSFLPCKISIYTQDSKTKIALLKPTFLLSTVDENLAPVAKEVEEKLSHIIDISI